MGNGNSNEIENNNQKNPNEKAEEIKKEKEKILKGSFEDRFKVENRDPLDFYDMIIDINSFSRKDEIIWKIQTKSNKKEKEKSQKENLIEQENQNKQEIDNDKENDIQNDVLKLKEETDNNEDIFNFKEEKIVVGVIGLGNVGKSFLLSLFLGEDLPSGESIHTKGISLKAKQKLIILDSEGVEAPLTTSNVTNELFKKEQLKEKEINESDNLIQNIAKDKKAVELFIQDFIIENSTILFIVVGQLTLTEQKLINRIINDTKKSTIFVIHNLKNFYTKEQINNYIENTFKKNIFLNFENFTEQNYKEEKEILDTSEEFNKYYLETYTNGNLEKKVIHLIMGSNFKGSQAFYYNKTAVDYVRTEIAAISSRRKFNIIEELKKFILYKAKKYVESEEQTNKFPFSENDIQIETKGDDKYIKIKNKTKLKKCLINQLGFSSFYGSLYSPNYTCYISENENKKYLYIDINLCGKNYKIEKPRREDSYEDGNKTIITIIGNKCLTEYKNFAALEGSTMDSGNFRIDIILENDKIKLKLEPPKKQKLKGLNRLIYSLSDNDNNNDNDTKMKEVKVEFSKKTKDNKKDEN